MTTYQVTHKKSGDRYFLLAESADRAVEVVELRLGDPERGTAWSAAAVEMPAFSVEKGVVYDDAGRPVTPLE